MATTIQGVTVNWGASTVAEVFEATLALQRDLPQARTAKWSIDLGTVTLRAFSRDALPDSDYGEKRRLTISARTGTSTATFTVFDADCVYLGAEITAELNNVWKFDHVLRVMDTVDGTTAYPS
jgi:hypothetical protein